MLNVEIAKKFIDRLTAYTNYNVNIMNERGVIIASRNSERIGTFHEIAYDIIVKNQPIMEVSKKDTFLGVHPGVNLPLVHNGQTVGVIGVTGEPKTVKPIALIVKMSMETMLEYEYEKELLHQRKNLKEQFIYQLIYEHHPDPDEIKALAQKLNYHEHILRIPILIDFAKKEEAEVVLQSIKASGTHTAQDLSFLTRDRQIMIFKTLPSYADVFSDYKYIIGEYLHAFLQTAIKKKETYYFYIGTIQNKFLYYRDAYTHCVWLEKHLAYGITAKTETCGGQTKKGSPCPGRFFYDYVDDYMKSILPDIELHKIYNCFRTFLDEKYIQSYLKLLEVMKENNYNMVSSSKALFVHKNTLSFQFDKIKSRLNLNPHQDAKAREFMEYLYYYLKNI